MSLINKIREACKNETCSKICIKSELGEDGNKLGSQQ